MAEPLALIRDGMIIGPEGVEIDFRTLDYSVWLTIKADTDEAAEAVAAALEARFAPEAATQERPRTQHPKNGGGDG